MILYMSNIGGGEGVISCKAFLLTWLLCFFVDFVDFANYAFFFVGARRTNSGCWKRARGGGGGGSFGLMLQVYSMLIEMLSFCCCLFSFFQGKLVYATGDAGPCFGVLGESAR